MKFFLRTYFLTTLLFGIISVNAQTLSEITYDESFDNFCNPDRGFYRDAYGQLTPSFVNGIRAQGYTLVHRNYLIPQFRTAPLSEDFLNTVRTDLQTARAGGVKMILRFFYTDYENGEDAALDTILLHISQLEPVFRENSDVIAFVDAGFIGAWGEWYYSSHGLNNTEDRRTVLFALLSALPENVDVVIRTPDYKRRIFNYSEPLTPDSAYSGSFRSRTGAHNDCFLADETDMGTYLWNDIEGDKDYLNADNRFLPQSGETCQFNSEFCGCENAIADLTRMHWSALNRDYNTTVIQYWIDNGCYPEIQRRLGYRFVLLNSEISDSVRPNGIFTLNFNIKNVGFGNPYKPRGCEVILRNLSDNSKYKLVTDTDPRFWYSGDTAHVEITGGIPSDMPEGVYEAFLFLPDTANAIHERPEYAIRLANENVWEDSTGYNSLLHDVIISNEASGENYSGNNYFVPFSSHVTPPPTSEIIIDGNFEDWANVPALDFGADAESEGDALNDNVDLLDMWVTNSSNELFVSYSVVGAFAGGYFYHVFFDTDNNPETGFHSAESYGGFDFMIENEMLYSYSGSNGEWGWNFVSAAPTAYSSDNSRLETAIPFSALGIAAGNRIGIVFNINDNNESVDDDYAPDAYQEHSFQYTIVATGTEDLHNRRGKSGEIKISAYPNPFNGIVTINLEGFNSQKDKVTIYDILGRKVRTYSLDEINGSKIHWRGETDYGNSVNSGVYFVVVSSATQTVSKKIIYLK